MVECSRMFFVAVVARLELSIFPRAYINKPLCVFLCVELNVIPRYINDTTK